MHSKQRIVLLLVAFVGGCMAEVGDTGDTYARGVQDLVADVQMHFDVSGLSHCNHRDSCVWFGEDGIEGRYPEGLSDPAANCFCQNDFERNNYVRVLPDGRERGHFVAIPPGGLAPQLRAVGNVPAYYVDGMNTTWRDNEATRLENPRALGRAEATRVNDLAIAGFGPGNVPRWFLLNEISRTGWLNHVEYRRYVIALARHLRESMGRRVIIFSPFSAPPDRGDGPEWRALASHARIAIESYVDGPDFVASGRRQSWARGQYEDSVRAYVALGIRRARLLLTEHFGHTKALCTNNRGASIDCDRGRAGVSLATWREVVRARTRAARAVDVFGYVSYGWGRNQMGAGNAARRRIQDLYHGNIGGGTLRFPAAGAGTDDDSATTGDDSTGESPSDPESSPAPPPPPAPAACGDLYGGCGAGSCCGGLSCGGIDSATRVGACCLPIRSECDSRDECCPGRGCVNGSCCIKLGDWCGSTAQCCNAGPHVCQANRCCVTSGQPCGSNDQCCSGSCRSARCE